MHFSKILHIRLRTEYSIFTISFKEYDLLAKCTKLHYAKFYLKQLDLRYGLIVMTFFLKAFEK